MKKIEAPANTAPLAEAAGTTMVERKPFGTLPDGTKVDLYTLTNPNDITVALMTYGGIIVSLQTPDRCGDVADIVLGFDTLDDYLHDPPYFGAIVGRYANRIAGGTFTLDGVIYRLVTNNGPNHLHGGTRGFDKVVWKATSRANDDAAQVTLTHVSPDGNEGYPGTLTATVTYTLTADNVLRIDYAATTDRATPVNLTQHSYFNLTGARRDVLDHVVQINADRYTPVDATLIPTGVLAPVHGTAFDFQRPAPLGAAIDAADPQLRHAGGYDHNFVFADDTAHTASVLDPESGRTIDVSTTEPGIQLYSGNFLDGSIRGKAGQMYNHRFGLCLETQHFPNSPNQPAFPPTILRPGERYTSRTEYRFGVEES
jgi:aldose 1-epimerase